jgi:hypothetical protein
MTRSAGADDSDYGMENGSDRPCGNFCKNLKPEQERQVVVDCLKQNIR